MTLIIVKMAMMFPIQCIVTRQNGFDKHLYSLCICVTMSLVLHCFSTNICIHFALHSVSFDVALVFGRGCIYISYYTYPAKHVALCCNVCNVCNPYINNNWILAKRGFWEQWYWWRQSKIMYTEAHFAIALLMISVLVWLSILATLHAVCNHKFYFFIQVFCDFCSQHFPQRRYHLKSIFGLIWSASMVTTVLRMMTSQTHITQHYSVCCWSLANIGI